MAGHGKCLNRAANRAQHQEHAADVARAWHLPKKAAAAAARAAEVICQKYPYLKSSE